MPIEFHSVKASNNRELAAKGDYFLLRSGDGQFWPSSGIVKKFRQNSWRAPLVIPQKTQRSLPPTGRTITHQVSSFTSSEFMKRFLSHDLIPPGLTASMITENETLYRQLIDNLYDGIEEVNESGGFEISGWLRKGFSIDQASKDSSKVKSSESILHLTFIDFPSAIVSNHLNDLYAYLQSGPVLSTQDGNLEKMSETGEIEESDGVDH